MKEAVLTSPALISQSPLKIEDIPPPEPRSGHVLLWVRACGVCRTDLHTVEGELPPRNPRIIPGHQIVGEVIPGDLDAITASVGTARVRTGVHARPVERSSTPLRVGVSWIGGTDGTCAYCRRGEENLCDFPTFTGYTVDGGYAQYTLARADFCFPIPPVLDDLHAAPLLFPGIIRFRSPPLSRLPH